MACSKTLMALSALPASISRRPWSVSFNDAWARGLVPAGPPGCSGSVREIFSRDSTGTSTGVCFTHPARPILNRQNAIMQIDLLVIEQLLNALDEVFKT